MDDAELRDLQERVQLVRDLIEQPGWPLLIDRANVALWSRQNLLVGGGAKDYEQYKTTVSWMQGAQYVISIPNMIQQEIDSELERRDELDRQEDD